MNIRTPLVALPAGNNSDVQAKLEPIPDADAIPLTFSALLVDLHANAPKGMAWGWSAAGQVERLAGDTGVRCLGLLTSTIALPNGKLAKLQTAGPFVATAAEWAAVTNDAAALTPGDIYFGSLATPGILFHGAIAAGHLALQIGIAFDATTLLLQIAPPVTV